VEPEDIALQGIAVVPEERRVFSNLTVEENLELSSISRSTWNTIRRKVSFSKTSTMGINELYGLFPVLEERRNQKAGSLSGGEQQMLSIARTLRLPDVELLMLDEPTEGLAPQIVDSVVEAIDAIADEGTTILLIEQNVKAALELSDRGYILEMGSIVHEGSIEELEREEVLDQYLSV
jgi:branched-chain amino acid transport system ATP-binding protein